jgi:quercetin dioxygenase-like cupin family protein
VQRILDAMSTAPAYVRNVRLDILAANQLGGQAPSRLRVNLVRFTPGARTAWHCHANGQTLHVTEGRGLVQSRGGEVIEIRPGDTIYTPPGQWHWHGAASEHFTSHLAMWESLGEGQQGPETEWGDHVTDEEYRAS